MCLKILAASNPQYTCRSLHLLVYVKLFVCLNKVQGNCQSILGVHVHILDLQKSVSHSVGSLWPTFHASLTLVNGFFLCLKFTSYRYPYVQKNGFRLRIQTTSKEWFEILICCLGPPKRDQVLIWRVSLKRPTFHASLTSVKFYVKIVSSDTFWPNIK